MVGEQTICRRWLVRGRVQGVGFRGYVVRTAGYLGLQGTVQNRADGSVEVVARGHVPELDEMAAALHRGPALARVTSVAQESGTLPAGQVDFRVVYGS